MYQVLMLHLIGESAFYLGAIGVVFPNEESDAVVEVEQWWENFQATKPESDTLFIDWLVEQDEAKEVRFDDESPNMPLQVYLWRN